MTVTTGQEEDIRRSTRMSLTYSDFPYYFNHSTNSLDNMDMFTGALPREFQVIHESQVPLLQNEEESCQDFIILAEFSELEGPIPLCTIPTNAPDKTDIALNNFAVHLMSTDYQVNMVGHFKICEDTQVLRKNVFEDVHVFMQYFTLYDIKARGFVRPFCFGYVSKDHVKLDRKLDLLINEFNKMTKVLKHANRKWFAGELEQYLKKLSKAKESFIKDLTPRGTSSKEEGVFYFDSEESTDDPDAITLDQIAHQFSEIENIFRTVKAVECPPLEWELGRLSAFLCCQPESTEIINSLQKLQIGYLPNAEQQSIASLNIPLVHPLKVKGESLRPLTTLGQLGSVHLIWRLLKVYKDCQKDLIFTQMAEFDKEILRFYGGAGQPDESAPATFESSTSTAASDQTLVDPTGGRTSSNSEQVLSSDPLVEGEDERTNVNGMEIIEQEGSFESACELILDPEVPCVLEKIDTSAPVASDNKSGSYHTVSEEESEVMIPSPSTTKAAPSSSNENDKKGESSPSAEEGTPTIPQVHPSSSIDTIESAIEPPTPFGTSPPATTTVESSLIPANKSPGGESKVPSEASGSLLHSRYSLSSYSSEDDMSSKSSLLSSQETTEEIIKKEAWWEVGGSKIVRGQPGYGIVNFFRHYHKVAHHILYSILLGRTIIICGPEELRAKVSRILTSLIPLVPCYPSKSWKLLRFHRGILVKSHLEEYKLIGLCIPERLEVHDMINPREQNSVTILNVQNKSVLLGPAYSGQFFTPFENVVQKHFYNSDVSLLSYIGAIYTEIETKVYMFKSIEEEKKSQGTSLLSFTNKRFNFSEIGLRASDADIVRHLGSLVANPEDVVNLF